ncbi:MAG: nucleotide exchange factor GrpE [Candidatus Eisenbacteria bacterium]|uniref:Protein GrpE n=1 Tax=Eiseniibacteriota bacterium TaxID=2212470 RepID=A0A956M0M4_UNCEI|nr:nucleotide exchange factor GrpE [Candidatus Eisenbacteria bacterium]
MNADSNRDGSSAHLEREHGSGAREENAPDLGRSTSAADAPPEFVSDPASTPGLGDDPEAAHGESAPAGAATPDLAAQYLDQLQRLKAEFDNYRKRIAREKEAWWRESRASVLSELLPVADDAARARAFSERGESLDAPGLELILKRFATILSKMGLEEMDTAPGTEFDPELHEAVLAIPSQESEGCIVETIEKGYCFEGQILRRGKVTVSSGIPPE